MITQIKVDGFRSLMDFSLALQPGLNILVGPNGSGKSNIIAFFDFLANLVQYGLVEAIRKSGGTGSLFAKAGKPGVEFQREIAATVTGCVLIGKSTEGTKKTEKYLNYKYHFVIQASEEFDKIVFSAQDASVYFSSVYQCEFMTDNKNFMIMQTGSDENLQYEIKNLDKEFIKPLANRITKEMTSDEIESELQRISKENRGDDISLIDAMNNISLVTININIDLCAGKMFNLLPSKIKTSEDSTSKAGIQSDGSGLAATLYAIEYRKKLDISAMRILAGTPIDNIIDIKNTTYLVTMTDILKFVRTANPAIEKITVVNDPSENLLKIKFVMKKNNDSITLPISAMSDGTVKWLSLVTALLTSFVVFSIEEPENFLHPLMQSEAVSLMRDTIENIDGKRMILMSTHSETILNSASPEEIIITEFVNGATRAKRCSNSKNVKEEIQKTGFGLSFYYLAGSLEHE